MVFYQVYAQIYPVQFGGVKCHSHIFKSSGASLPPPYLNSFYNFYTVRKYFSSLAQAKKFVSRLRSKFAVSPSYPPNYLNWLRTHYRPYYVGSSSASGGGQLSLF